MLLIRIVTEKTCRAWFFWGILATSAEVGLIVANHLVLQRHVRQLSMAQVNIFQELKSFLRISIITWLMDQNPCETSHFLAIGVLTQRVVLAHLYRADGTTRLLGADEELTIPDLLGDFHVRVGRFFE